MSLNILSFPVLSFLPGLFCVKKGFPFIATAPITINMMSSQDKTQIARNDKNESKTLLKKFRYILFKTSPYNFNHFILLFRCHLVV